MVVADCHGHYVGGVMRDLSFKFCIRPVDYRLLVFVSSVVLALAVATVAPVSADTKQDTTLRLLHWQAPMPFYPPYKSGAYKDLEALRLVYEPLASFDPDGNLVPVLAAEIPTVENGGRAPDGSWVIWNLKKGILWGDGKPFSADDVLYTYKILDENLQPAVKAIKNSYDGIEAIEKLDPHRVKISFGKPNVDWALPFTGRYGFITPRHVMEPANNIQNASVPQRFPFYGTGPFYLKGFHREESLMIGSEVISMVKLEFERNPHFREQGKPEFDRVEFRGGGDAVSSAHAVVVEGIADFAFDIQMSSDKAEKLEERAKGYLTQSFGTHVESIMLNFSDPELNNDKTRQSGTGDQHPILKDKRVRQAIALAVDRNTIAELFGELGRPTSNIIVSPPSFSSEKSHYPHDLDRSIALLEEAGWQDADGDGIREKDGRRLKLLHQTTINPLRKQIQDTLKLQLLKAGIELELKAVESSVFFSLSRNNSDSIVTFSADMQQYYAGPSFPDPSSYLVRWHSKNIPAEKNDFLGTNLERWINAKYDALQDKLAQETDANKRRTMVIRLNDILIDEVVRIPLVNRASVHAVGDQLTEVSLSPWDVAVWNVKDWRRREGTNEISSR